MATPLYTVTELRAIEQAAQRELPPGELMARAGARAAAHIESMHAARKPSVCVLCGPGNNGGDGYVTALQLRAAEHDVVCVQVARPTTSDARTACTEWRAAGGETRDKLPSKQTFNVIVDAMLGIGQTRPLQGAMLAAAAWSNEHGAKVVALDVPSGLDADRGCWVGDVDGVRASATITFIGDKPGLHTADGLDAAGIVTVDALGTQPAATRTSLTDTSDFPQITAPRRHNTHKGTYGNALVIGGSAGMVGAALLAARAALRIGAGRVYVDCVGAPEMRVDPMQPELMFRAAASIDNLRCVVIGCGLGTDDPARRALQWALDSDAPLVIDADALNLLARGPALAECLTARSAPTVLTPHPLEAARLLDVSASDVQLDRVAAAREIAVRHRCIVVLKGAGSIVADTHGRCAINPTGGPALATAGTGDVLAGLIGGLIAQAFDVRQATLAGVWLHGSADDCGAGLVASEVATKAVQELRKLRH